MAARIRSLRNGLFPIDEASRNDLVATDVVTVSALDAATTYLWVLAFVPDGSAATFSGDPTQVTPGTFTVDLEGPYLVKLTVDLGLPTESTQYVRLRALTTTLGLKLVSAGERRDGTGIIPVDVDPEGWANEQNFNLQTLEAAAVTVRGFGPAQLVLVSPYPVGTADGVLLVNVGGLAILTLPPIAAYTGPGLWIKDRSGNAFFNNIQIIPFGGETIDGAPALIINQNYGAFCIVPLGLEWSVMAVYP